MDKISISGLQVTSLIGVYDWERQAKTNLSIDVELGVDLTTPAVSDDVNDTLDYAEVASVIEQCAANASFKLLEALAQHIITTLFEQFAATQIRITLRKPGILPNATDVAVCMERQR